MADELVYVSEAEFDREVARFNERVAKSAKIKKLKASARFRRMTMTERIAALHAISAN